MTTTTTLPGVRLEYPDLGEPQDLDTLRPWLNVIRRLRSVASNGGFSVVKITILTCDGVPVNWTTPEAKAIEPKANGYALDALLRALSE